MKTTTNNEAEMLVLADQEGGHFVIPRQALEQYRVTEEQLARIEKAVELDCPNLDTLYDLFLTEHLVDQALVEKQREGAELRLAAALTRSEHEERESKHHAPVAAGRQHTMKGTGLGLDSKKLVIARR